MLDLKHLVLQYVINEQGQKTAVILPIDQFEELIEDLEDLATIAERREEPTIAHSDLVSELKQNGLL